MRIIVRVAAIVAAIALWSAPAHALEEVGQWYVSPNVSFIWVDSSRNTDDEVGGYLFLGRAFENFNLEASAFYYDLGGFDQTDMWGFELSIVKQFYRNERITPYISGGYGYIDKERDIDDDDQNDQATFAFGFLTDITRDSKIAVRTELRWRIDFEDDNTENDVIGNIGLQIPFGKPRQ